MSDVLDLDALERMALAAAAKHPYGYALELEEFDTVSREAAELMRATQAPVVLALVSRVRVAEAERDSHRRAAADLCDVIVAPTRQRILAALRIAQEVTLTEWGGPAEYDADDSTPDLANQLEGEVTAMVRMLAERVTYRESATPPPKTGPCPRCGGSGFSGFGTGYDDVCSWCAGTQEVELEDTEREP